MYKLEQYGYKIHMGLPYFTQLYLFNATVFMYNTKWNLKTATQHWEINYAYISVIELACSNVTDHKFLVIKSHINE